MQNPKADIGNQDAYTMEPKEYELRSVTDLAYVLQDYETCAAFCSQSIPGFKSIKAFKHWAHSEEIQLFARLANQDASTMDWSDVVDKANQIFEIYNSAK